MRHKLLAIGFAVAAAALVPADANAADTLSVKGAYLYVEHVDASRQSFVRVVFRTTRPLPRRFDGLIRASASIDRIGHSLGTAKRGTTCYTTASKIAGHSIAVRRGDSVVRKGAKLGRTFTVTVATRDAEARPLHLRLRAERHGDRTGKPLGC